MQWTEEILQVKREQEQEQVVTYAQVGASHSQSPPPPNMQCRLAIFRARRDTQHTPQHCLTGGRGVDSAKQMLLCTSSGHFFLTGNISSGNRLMPSCSQFLTTTLYTTRSCSLLSSTIFTYGVLRPITDQPRTLREPHGL